MPHIIRDFLSQRVIVGSIGRLFGDCGGNGFVPVAGVSSGRGLEGVEISFQLKIEVDAEESTGGDERHAEDGDHRRVNLALWGHEDREHNERHAENDQQECEHCLRGDLAAYYYVVAHDERFFRPEVRIIKSEQK